MVEILHELKPQISFFAETQLSDNSGFKMDGYTFCGKSRLINKSGGVGILVRDDIKPLVTPHEPSQNIEMFWISINRKNEKPIYCAIYYGKQESRNSTQVMKEEMDKLCEEIMDKSKDGEVIVFMDANAKINILNEGTSRNGGLLLLVIEGCELNILNSSTICKGKVTRLNRNKPNEQSAIDLVLATSGVFGNITEMLIDEEEKYLLTGNAPSDHNSIVVKLTINGMKSETKQKISKWRLSAPDEKWEDFQEKLSSCSAQSRATIESESLNIDEKYAILTQQVDKIARATIGRTTIPKNGRKYESPELKALRKEKRELRKSFEKEKNRVCKREKLDVYAKKQEEVRQQIEVENQKSQKDKFEKMISSENGFWGECKRQERDVLNDWTAVKNVEGERILDPENQKEVTADYCQRLYSPDDSLPGHEYHEIVKQKIYDYMSDFTFDDEDYNDTPTFAEVENAVKNKKNNKSTTDFPNEMLKRGGQAFIKWLYPIVREFWEKEVAPKIWNKGLITMIYKGKGDREMLNFQRGITVSSTISMVCEDLINSRMTRIVPLTQAQGGGKKGSSTRDHLFILRGAMAYALKHKKELYVTFYDVTKAYDRADVDHMLVEVWEHGMKGKAWRLLRLLNTNLTAQIKTRHGLTRTIDRKVGGKQGGKNFGFLFAKMMDLLQEEAEGDEKLGVVYGIIKLIFLLWVDDVVSFAEGSIQQNQTLQMVDNFARKHKLKWGTEKCKVMPVGKTAYTKSSWQLGDQQIETADSYKYLGDVIMRNNGNQKNIEDRENKVKMITRKAMSTCSSEVIANMEMAAILKLHETRIISTLLTNSETWVLQKEQLKKIERIELWALKRLIGLPPTTPTVAIVFLTGCLYTTQRIHQRQLVYLKTLLNRPDYDWSKLSLLQQDSENLWWAKQINELLEQYDLDFTWEQIRLMPFAEWKRRVKIKIEEKHIERMKDECGGADGEKTKTKHFCRILQDKNFQRKTAPIILNRSKIGARAIIMGMSGMLDCKNNYHHKYKTKICDTCEVIDDESHRINDCKKFEKINLYNSNVKFDYSCIYSMNSDAVDRAEYVIRQLWDISNNKNEMFSS